MPAALAHDRHLLDELQEDPAITAPAAERLAELLDPVSHGARRRIRRPRPGAACTKSD